MSTAVAKATKFTEWRSLPFTVVNNFAVSQTKFTKKGDYYYSDLK